MKREVITAFLVAAVVAGCDVDCDNEIISSIPSPNGSSRAVVFNRGCAATTGFNTQVSVVPAATSSIAGAGNVLILGGTVPLQLQWVSESSLNISGPGSAQVFKQVVAIDGVSVTYDK